MTDIVLPSWVFDDDSAQMLRDSVQNMRDTTDRERVVLTVAHSGRPVEGLDVDHKTDMNPPQGWAAALNHAFLTTDAPMVVVGSIDIRMPQGWLEQMLDMAADGRTIVSPVDVKRGVRRVWDSTERGSFWGGWYLFPRVALAEVGLLDGYGFRHMADMDWGLRAKAAGFRTVRATEVHARHIRPHHTQGLREGPLNKAVRQAFRKKWGTTHLGAWERGGR